MSPEEIQKMRELAEIAANGDGHRPHPCPICELAALAEKAADALEEGRQ